jgi:hypothetical protein
MNLGPQTHQDLRDAVRALCNQYDSAYWQKVDEERAYPEAFVDALTRAGCRRSSRRNTAARGCR